MGNAVVTLASVLRSSCNAAETYHSRCIHLSREGEGATGSLWGFGEGATELQTPGPLQRPCCVMEMMSYSGTLDSSGGDPVITLIPSKSGSVASRGDWDWQAHALLAVSSASATCSHLPTHQTPALVGR